MRPCASYSANGSTNPETLGLWALPLLTLALARVAPGGKTVIFARFLPIVRTFAPFVAGIGRMTYPKFMFYSFSGSVFWIAFFVFGGYYFGNIPVVRQNLTLFIIGIIVVSVMPGIVEFVRQKVRSRA